jgi:hypothetical protein
MGKEVVNMLWYLLVLMPSKSNQLKHELVLNNSLLVRLHLIMSKELVNIISADYKYKEFNYYCNIIFRGKVNVI